MLDSVTRILVTEVLQVNHGHNLVSLTLTGIRLTHGMGFGGHLDFSMWLVPRAGFPVRSTLLHSRVLMVLSVTSSKYRVCFFHDQMSLKAL